MFIIFVSIPGECSRNGVYYDTLNSYTVCRQNVPYKQNCVSEYMNRNFGSYVMDKPYGYQSFCCVPVKASQTTSKKVKASKTKSDWWLCHLCIDEYLYQIVLNNKWFLQKLNAFLCQLYNYVKFIKDSLCCRRAKWAPDIEWYPSVPFYKLWESIVFILRISRYFWSGNLLGLEETS